MGAEYKPMPMAAAGSLTHRITSHVQGVCVTPYGLAYSRNGVDHGQLLIPGRPKHALTQFRYAHAGGIDSNGDHIAIPLYDKGEGSAHLCLWYNGHKTLYPLPRRPYACGIEAGFGGFIVALVSCPNGSRIDWYRMPRRKGTADVGGTGGQYDFHSVFSTFHDASTAPRNNIALRRGSIDAHDKPYALRLWALRAKFGRSHVDRYAVSAAKQSVMLRHERRYSRRNASYFGCSSRYGATIRYTYRQAGIEVSLIRTARNIGIPCGGEDTLRVREDIIQEVPSGNP